MHQDLSKALAQGACTSLEQGEGACQTRTDSDLCKAAKLKRCASQVGIGVPGSRDKGCRKQNEQVRTSVVRGDEAPCVDNVGVGRVSSAHEGVRLPGITHTRNLMKALAQTFSASAVVQAAASTVSESVQVGIDARLQTPLRAAPRPADSTSSRMPPRPHPATRHPLSIPAIRVVLATDAT
jgi:hypothetical protein